MTAANVMLNVLTEIAGNTNNFLPNDAKHDVKTNGVKPVVRRRTTGTTGMTIKMNKSEDGEIDVQVEMEEGGEWVEETREAGEKVEKRVKIIKEEAEEHE